MFFDAESLGRAGTTGIQGWCGTGTLLVLISRMNPSFPRMVTIAWSTGQEAVITDVDLQAPCTLQGPGVHAGWVDMRVRSQLLALVSEV